MKSNWQRYLRGRCILHHFKHYAVLYRTPGKSWKRTCVWPKTLHSAPPVWTFAPEYIYCFPFFAYDCVQGNVPCKTVAHVLQRFAVGRLRFCDGACPFAVQKKQIQWSLAAWNALLAVQHGKMILRLWMTTWVLKLTINKHRPIPTLWWTLLVFTILFWFFY